MEGVLYKWTNYLSGWQPRWFLLAGGVLSYYDSREDAWKGCKGSIQMAVCEIQVHPTDDIRVDLTIPGEQYFYLKAKNAAERQKWVVALGTAKACLTDIRTLKEKEYTENTEALKIKIAELRLYCDLLVQQVDKTKNGINMGELLKPTCTSFLKTLDECMQIANAAFSSELLHHAPSGTPHLALWKLNKLKLPSLFSHGAAERKMELKSCENGSICAKDGLPDPILTEESPTPVSRKIGDMDHKLPPTGGSKKERENKLLPKKDNQEKPSEIAVDSLNKSAQPEKETVKEFPTFFSAMTFKFNDIKLAEDGGIPTEKFLQSCYEIVPVLDKLGSTVFAPVKMDFEGNIKKINQKFITNKEEFDTLQKIVFHELSTEQALVPHSATQALMWLRRGLKFLKEFLTELKNGEKNIKTALSQAYGKTLRQYHGWVVRGVFALALRASPTYEGFASALSVGEYDYEEEAFYNGLKKDLDIYLPAMEEQIGILEVLYEEHGLESDEVV